MDFEREFETLHEAKEGFDGFLARYKEYIKKYKEKPITSKNPLLSFSKFTDETIKNVYKLALLKTNLSNPPKLALIMQGSWSRREVCLYSDIDLMITCENQNEKAVEDFIQNFLYISWDLGLNVKHRVHELKDIITASKDDVTIKTTMLESKYLCGNKSIWDKTKKELEKIKSKHLSRFLTLKFDEIEERKKTHPFKMEINLKQSSGGLRDYHAVLWVAKVVLNIKNLSELSPTYISPLELKRFKNSINFINKVRFYLHFVARKKQDVLALEYIPEISDYFNKSHMTLSQDVFKAMWNIKTTSQILINAITHPIFTKRFKQIFIKKLSHGFYKHKDVIYAPLDEKTCTLEELLKLFISLEDKEYCFDISVISYMKCIVLHEPISDDIYKLLSHIFHRNFLNQFMYLFYKSGLFAKLFPPLKHIVSLPQFDGYHTYTVGIHTLKSLLALENIEDVFVKSLYEDLCENGKYLLKLVLLFHDSGKGKKGNHNLVGAKLFKSFCHHFELNDEMKIKADRLIRHHTLMSNTAYREDIYNENVIFSFLAAIKDEQTLKLLYILTYCDIKGVGRNFYNNFNSRLIRELYDISLNSLSKDKLLNEAQKRRNRIKILTNNTQFKTLSPLKQKKILNIQSNLFFLKFKTKKILEIAQTTFDTKSLDFKIENGENLSIEIIRKNDINISYIFQKLSYINVVEMEIFDLFDDFKYFKVYFQNSINKYDIFLVEKIIKDAANIELKEPKIIPIIKKGDFKLDCEHSQTYAKLNLNTNDQKGLLAFIMYIFDKYGIKITSAKIQTIKNRTRNLFLIEKQGILCDNKDEIMNLLYTYTKTKAK